ncbi:hypothetical protein KI387_008449, partial [Taxus chinensis]
TVSLPPRGHFIGYSLNATAACLHVFPLLYRCCLPLCLRSFFHRTSLDLSAAEPAKEESSHRSDGLF